MYPLHVKTDSVPGGTDKIRIRLLTEGGDFVTVITLHFENYKYRVDYCTPNATPDYPTMLNVPRETGKTWIFTKSSKALTITCNGVEVAYVVYDAVNKEKVDKCVSRLSQSVKKIRFEGSASDKYLTPGNIPINSTLRFIKSLIFYLKFF